MRPTRYKREFAVAQTVADMKRRFVYPDEDTQPRNPVVGGAGGAMTIQVAASDASRRSQQKADMNCPGVNDQAVVFAAVTECSAAGGGRVLLSEGTFNFGGGMDMLSGVKLEGMQQGGNFLFGRGTTFRRVPGAADDYIVFMSGAVGASVEWIRFWDQDFQTADGVVITGAESNRVTDCRFDWCRRGVDHRGDDAWVAQNYFDLCSTGIRVAGADVAAVVGNHIHDAGQGVTHGIELSGDEADLWLIADNAIDIRGGFGIYAESVHATIHRNLIRKNASDTTDGIFVDGDRNQVFDNVVLPLGAFRSGINIDAGNDNAVYANYLGDASAYGTADFIDNGTATMTAPGANGQFSY